MKKKYLLLPLFFIVSVSLSYKEDNDKYDLNFHYLGNMGDVFSIDDKLRSQRWMIFSYPMSRLEINIDSTILIGNKHPTIIDVEREHNDPIEFYLTQEIAIPRHSIDKNQNITLSFNCKTENIDSLLLSIMTLDSKNKLLDIKTSNVSNKDWGINTITMPIKPEICHLYIQIKAFDPAPVISENKMAKKDNTRQRILLDRMNIMVGNISINDMPQPEETDENLKLELTSSAIINLHDRNNGFDCSKLPASVREKLVIGLGESIHGSSKIEETVYDIIKSQVENYNCRHILFETSMTAGLYLDLFIQGKLPDLSLEQTLQQIRNKRILSTADGNQNLENLLLFLRNYNSQTNEKVHIWGVDIPLTGSNPLNDLADYVLGYTNKQNIEILKPLLLAFDNPIQYSAENNTTDFFSLLDQKQADLKKIMGKENYMVFRYVVDKFSYSFDTDASLANNQTDSEGRRFFKSLIFRDSYKWDRTKGILDLFPLSSDRRMVIYMHEGHLRKGKNTYPHPIFNPKMYGDFLSEFFVDEYYSINLLVGQGERKVIEYKGINKEKLQPPPLNSIESVGLNKNLTAFYYPAQDLPNETIYIKHLGFDESSDKQFDLLRAKELFDGFIFLIKTELSKETKKLIQMPKSEIDSINWNYLYLREKAIGKFIEQEKTD